MAASRRRIAAKRRAQQAMTARRRSERRTKVLVCSGVLVAVVAALTAVVLVLVTSPSPGAVAPRNLASDGIVVGEGFRAERAPAVEVGSDPIPTETATDGKTVSIQLYADYLCPNCRAFEEENGDYLSKVVESGAATVEFHPIAIMDRVSQGTKYATRAAAAAVCVADLAPDSFFAVNRALFAAQPAEHSPGLSDSELADVVGGVAGLTARDRVLACLDDQRFAPWVTAATKRAVKGHFPGTDVTAFRGTPTVVVDGKEWRGEQPFTEFVTTAIGESTTHD
ncbi:hypothetical protein GCM10025867_04610 [Frondihabitans sucicola]|uniref:Thioredoxin-like fold domain-containing protein n=1 Tax=Frondihabitans sucicola TaxID=1268041 RepID=A0ABM8GIL5_9MICO|nr:thioredoxin domain-containing protein [Frondihabitans sucicola]BDZ48220.1 hypothetical protein GCM10025867_04610 [Frondihabitans sucicola]